MKICDKNSAAVSEFLFHKYFIHLCHVDLKVFHLCVKPVEPVFFKLDSLNSV